MALKNNDLNVNVNGRLWLCVLDKTGKKSVLYLHFPTNNNTKSVRTLMKGNNQMYYESIILEFKASNTNVYVLQEQTLFFSINNALVYTTTLERKQRVLYFKLKKRYNYFDIYMNGNIINVTLPHQYIYIYMDIYAN